MEPSLQRSKFISRVSLGIGLVSILFFFRSTAFQNDPRALSEPKAYNPCCDFPCENRGVCINLANNTYYCDCTATGHYGLNCQIPSWSEKIKKAIKPSPETMHFILTRFDYLWSILNSIKPLHRLLMKYVYLTRSDLIDSPPLYASDHSYTTLDVYYNQSYFVRALPPIPSDCPTPMGSKGPKVLIGPKELFKRVFLRRTFKPEPHDTNLLFQYYAQHFTHQFFRTDYASNGKLTKGTGGVDISNIYGLTEDIRQGLRSRVDGKLKTQTIQGEEFPPLLKDCPGVVMEYPPNVPIPEDAKFALGHPFFALLPGLFVYATIWVREHNRVCDIMKGEHPHWDDERLYQTARLIITGEVIKITIESYIQHLSQYNVRLSLEPDVIYDTRFQFHNRIYAEFDHMYHWHPLVPDAIDVNGTKYQIMDMAYSTAAVFKHGLDNFISALVENRAGALTARNHPSVVEPVFVKAITNTRLMRFQGLNQYRRRFGLQPFKSFRELTGEDELSKELEDIYKDIDAVEYYVGMVAEEPGPSITPLTMVNAGGPWSVKGLIANPICSPYWWRPSTFGGDVGFNIIQTASLKKLFCNNMKTACKHISFTVPPGTP